MTLSHTSVPVQLLWQRLLRSLQGFLAEPILGLQEVALKGV